MISLARARSVAPVEEAAADDLGAEEEILLDRHLRHQREVLEDGGDAEPPRLMHRFELDRRAAEADFAAARRLDAGEDRDQRRLAGAVLAEEDMHLAGAEIEIDAVEGEDAGILLADPDGLDEVSGAGPGAACRCGLRLGHAGSPARSRIVRLTRPGRPA